MVIIIIFLRIVFKKNEFKKKNQFPRNYLSRKNNRHSKNQGDGTLKSWIKNDQNDQNEHKIKEFRRLGKNFRSKNYVN